jgi:predicted DsbA family dithiol-disulfide isomerase
LKIAALERGEPILRRDFALSLAVNASGLDLLTLETGMEDPTINAEIKISTAELNSYRINQRPAFVIRSAIEDTVIFSGICRSEPLIAAIDAMIADENAYARFAVAHASIPT